MAGEAAEPPRLGRFRVDHPAHRTPPKAAKRSGDPGLRRVQATIVAGRRFFPAYIREAVGPTKRRGRPKFTRRTVERVLHSVRANQSPGDPQLSWAWRGTTLVVRNQFGAEGPFAYRPDADHLYALFDRSDWAVLDPPWPRRTPGARAVIRLLSTRARDRRPLMVAIAQRVPLDTIEEAYRQANPTARLRLIYALDYRQTAVENGPLLLEALGDRSPWVRRGAARGLRHLARHEHGPAMLRAAIREQNGPVLWELIGALTASEYTPAIDWLRYFANDSSVSSEWAAEARAAAEWLADRRVRDNSADASVDSGPTD
jgi:hypothetical protein